MKSVLCITGINDDYVIKPTQHFGVVTNEVHFKLPEEFAGVSLKELKVFIIEEVEWSKIFFCHLGILVSVLANRFNHKHVLVLFKPKEYYELTHCITKMPFRDFLIDVTKTQFKKVQCSNMHHQHNHHHPPSHTILYGMNGTPAAIVHNYGHFTQKQNHVRAFAYQPVLFHTASILFRNNTPLKQFIPGNFHLRFE